MATAALVVILAAPTAYDARGATGGVSAVGEAATGPAGPSSYAFLARDASRRPVRYNPCVPIRYVVNPDGAPAGAVGEVREAFGRLAAATGLRFADAGSTTERHVRIGGPARPAYQPGRYGTGRWAPVLVSWVTEADEPILAGSILGYGGSTSFHNRVSDEAYVTGEIVLDQELTQVRPGFGPGLTRGNLLLHELGHVVGLDHTPEPDEAMAATISSRSPDGYALGDRAGLALVGAGQGCLREASPLGGVLRAS